MTCMCSWQVSVSLTSFLGDQHQAAMMWQGTDMLSWGIVGRLAGETGRAGGLQKLLELSTSKWLYKK